MKKRLLMYVLLMMAWLTVPWAANAANVYVGETFDLCTDGLPDGWINKDEPQNPDATNQNNVWVLSTHRFINDFANNKGFEGTTCVMYDSYSIQNLSNTLLTPVFTPGQGKAVTLSFLLQNRTSRAVEVAVYSADGATKLDVLDANLKTTDDQWKECVYTLKDYSSQAGGVRIGFYVAGDYGSHRPAIDNVFVEDPPTCAMPVGLQAVNATTDGFTLNWALAENAGAASNVFKLRIKDASGKVVKNETITSTDNTYTVTGLNATSVYTVELITDCCASYQGESKPATTQARTLAGPTPLPIAQDFSVSDFSELYGWGRFAQADYYVPVYDWDGHDAPGFMQIQVDGGGVTTVVMPQMQHEFTDIQLSMWVKGQKDTKFTIGVMDNPADPASFIDLTTATITENSVWREYRFNTSIYTDFVGLTDVSFAIRMQNTDGFASIMVDDVKIEKAPACPRIEDVVMTSMDTSSVTVSYFTYSPAATVKAKVVKADGSESVKDLTPTVDAANHTATAVIDGLEPSNSYTIYLMSECSATETSEQSAPLQVTTPCGTRRDLLFHETFKSDNWQLPSCWEQEVEGQSQSAWQLQQIGDKGDMYVSMTGNSWGEDTARVRLIAQPVLIPKGSAGKYDLKFRMNRVENISNGGYGEAGINKIDGLQVYISTSASVESATKCEFLPVNYEQTPAERFPGWYEYTFNINADGVVYVIFEGVSRGGQVALDDVQLVEAPACRPTKFITLAEPTATSATLSWRAEGATQWSVDYTLTSANGVVTKTETVNTKPEYKFDGLQAGVLYTVKGFVTTMCGGEKATAVPFEYVFETSCSDITALPFIETFDDDQFVPACWAQYYNYRGYKGSIDMLDSAWVRNTDAKYVANGKGSAQVRRVSERATKVSMVTPAIVIPQTGNYRLTFYLQRDNRTNYDGLLVIASPSRDIKADAKDTVLLADYRIGRSFAPAEAKEGMYKYFIDLPESLRGKQHFIFEATVNDKNSTFYVDEVSISQVEACDYVKGSLRFDSIRHDAVRVTVVGDNQKDRYEVEYGEQGFKLGEGTKVVIDAVDAPITGLSADMVYDVYVRRYCDDANQSEWGQRPQSFATLCSPVVISAHSEFLDNFEDNNIDQTINACYIQQCLKDTLSFVGGGADVNASIYPLNGRRYAKSLSHADIDAPKGIDTYVLRPMSLKKGKYYEVSALVVSDMPRPELTTVAFVYGQSPEKDGSMMTISTHRIGNKWTLVRGYIYNVLADGTYYVGWNAKQEIIAKFVGIDDFRVREVTCVPPHQTAVENITNTTATLKWESVAEKWDVKVLTVNNVESTEGVVFEQTIETTKNASLTGLNANTKYYYFIRSVCSDAEKSTWTEAGSFTTPCDMVEVPLTEDFEDAALANFACWKVQGSADRDVSVASGGSASLRTSGNAMIVSPKLNVTSLAGYRFKAYVYALAPTTVTIGVMVDPNEISTFQDLTVLNITREKRWTELLGYFEELNTADYEHVKDAKYIAVQFGSDNVYIDDIAIEVADACPQPTEPVFNNIGGNSVEIAWSENGTATSWKVEVLQGGVLVFDTTVTTNPATISGLSPLTEYTLNISSMCGETPSAKAEMGIFKTVCGAQSVPYNAGIALNNRFDESDPRHKQMPACWASVLANPETEESEYGSRYNAWIPNRAYNYIYYKYTGITEENQKGEHGASAVLATTAFDLTNAVNPKLEASLRISGYDTVYVLISKDGGATYEDFDTVVRADNKNDYKVSYDLNVHKGANVSFGFKPIVTQAAIDDSWSEVRLNSFEIKVDESCSRPTGIKLLGATDSTATIQITDTCATHTQWEVSYGPEGVNPDKGAIVKASKMYELSGLLPLTSYDVYVRAICGDTDKSYWVGPLTVITECAATALLPFVENFEAYDVISQSCLEIINQDRANKQNKYPNAEICSKFQSFYLSYVNEGSKALFLTSYTEYPLYVVLPKFEVSADSLRVKFDYRNDLSFDKATTQSLTLGLVNPATEDFVPYLTLPLSSQFRTIEYRFPYVAPEHKEYQIAFRYSDQSGNYGKSGFYSALDAISVTVDNGCPGASKFELVGAGKDSIEVAYSGISAQVEVAYGLAGTSPDECQTIKADTKADNGLDTVVIKGLKPATTYYIFSRGVNADGKVSDWSAPMIVTTECEVIEVTKEIALFENFDTYEDMGTPFPPCFTILKSDKDWDKQIDYPLLSTDRRVSEPRALALRSDNAVALPAITAELHQTILSFDVMGGGYFRIGVVDDLGAYYHGNTAAIKYLPGGDSDADGNYRGFAAYRDVRHFDFDMTRDSIKGKYFVFETFYQPTYGNNQPVVYIDNVNVIVAPTCFEPRNLKQTNLLDTAVAYSWFAAPDATDFEYKVESFEIRPNYVSPTLTVYDTIYTSVNAGTVKVPEVEVGELTANTEYRLSVRTICADCEDTTKWESQIFRTLRVLGRIPFISDFENEEENKCWYFSGEDNGGGWSFNSFTIDTAKAAVFQGERAMYVRLYGGAQYGYRPLDWNANKPWTNYASRYFYLEPGNYDVEYDWKQPSTGEENMARVFVVPADLELDANNIDYCDQMIPAGAFVVDEGPMKGQVDWKRSKVAFKLDKPGMYKLVVGWTNKTEGRNEAANLPIAIDNITMENHQLNAPSNLRLDSVAADSAWISWDKADNDTFRVRVLDRSYNLVVGTIVDSVYTFGIGGLDYATAYTAQVRAQVDRYISEWIELDFTSECVIPELPYAENFDGLKAPAMPTCWVATGAWETHSFNNSLMAYRSAHEAVSADSIVTPAFRIDKTGYHLTYSYHNNTSDGMFTLKASVDGGEFAVVAADGQTKAMFEDRWFSLDKYVGKDVTFALVADVKTTKANTRIAIDNFRISCVDAKAVEYTDEICSSNGNYDNYGFNIPADELTTAGEKVFERLVQGATADVCDHIERLRLTIGQSFTTTIDTTICKGQGYVSEAFPKSDIYPNGLVETNQYKATLPASTGCDSIIILNLVVEDNTSVIDTVVCEGNVYTFAGKEITESGTYVDSVITAEGCDYTTTLNITFQPREYVSTKYYCSGQSYEYKGEKYTETKRFEEKYVSKAGCDSIMVYNFIILADSTVTEATICEGKSYIFAGEEYTETGVYRKKFTNVAGCDSVAVLKLTVTTAEISAISDVACQGKPYNDNGFYNVVINKDTVITRIDKTAEGCDSVIQLTLKMIPTVKVDTTITIKEGEVYNFGGNDLTEAGEYTHTFTTEEGCDSIVNLTLVVKTGVENVAVQALTIAPNPVRLGVSTAVHRDWTADEQDGLRVEVLNSVGQIVDSYNPTVYPIEIEPIHVSGVYYIRIITGTGDVYVGKLIVK